MTSVSIVGMGYVGLPLGLSLDAEGYDVVGYDTDEQKVEAFNRGDDPTTEVGSEAVRRSNITFTADQRTIASSDYYIITVPTPIDETGRPDLSFVEAAGETVGNHLTEGSTVVLESTVFPGATREVLLPALERESGRVAGEGFFVGYSPERIVPGNSAKDIEDIVKIVSGHDETALNRLRSLYDDIVDAGIHTTRTMEIAEAAKCLENTQRDVNIALMNEFALGCQQVDIPIDAREVIDAASTKWNFHEYHPGSVGGHCIPVDPKYLIWKFEQHGFEFSVMRAAREVNSDFAAHIARITTNGLTERMQILDAEPEAVNADGGQLSESKNSSPRILVLGLAYKPNTTDIRSPVLKDAIDRLQDIGEVVGIDPHAPNEEIRSNFDITVQDELSVEDFDALLVTTPHDQFKSLDLGALSGEMNELPLMVDVTGTYDYEEAIEQGFLYRGL
ncbi:nucleotide sugar dehydrogenase [Haloarcula marina]|uniref:nucleotide sugar dehydrogenase n=1 Tax=Haloarcula marina TaxID=2961574 RepID=UPI0020B7BECA|nr:nucleotide sugar dehydrogenase [Halomicroarcula marina]